MNDVSRLFATQAVATCVESFEHVAVPHRRLDHRKVFGFHRNSESQVGHDGDYDGVVCESTRVSAIQRGHGDNAVTIDHFPVGANSGHSVGVAIECEPHTGAAFKNGLL